MPLIEEISDGEAGASGVYSSSTVGLFSTIKQLAARLALPEEFLSSYIHDDSSLAATESYRVHALSTLEQIDSLIEPPQRSDLDLEEQGEVLSSILRLYGHDPWTSKTIRETIDRITESIDKPSLALYLLESLRPLFSSTPHPMLNTETSRALHRPAGGSLGQSDFNDSESQPFKQPASWGCHNILAWATSHLPPAEVEKRIGLILPPTLVLMDDWEPFWRARGVCVLDAWMGKIDPELMRRMGIDKLLRSSIIHTMGLHASPPLTGVLKAAVRLINLTTAGKEKADAMAEVVNKGVIQGWTYAPSGIEGRRVLMSVAEDLELLCRELGVGIVRWLKTIIPHLLDPLQYIPTVLVLPHYRANLTALLCVLQTIRSTGRAARWRGQIIDVLCRLWIQLADRGTEELEDKRYLVNDVEDIIKRIFAEIKLQSPTVQQNMFADLVNLDSTVFRPLISVS